jgi:hypothetical protein
MGLQTRIGLDGITISLKLGDYLDTGIHLRSNIFTTARTTGIRNTCEDGKRIIFLDYDFVLYEDQLLPELCYLQDTYHLGDFYIFKSSQKPDSYHVICLDKLEVGEWQGILQDTSCDEAYKRPRIKDYKSSVLRITPKGTSHAPRFICVLHSDFQGNPKSRPHMNYLKLAHGIKIGKLKYLDNYKSLIHVNYPTTSNIKK